MVFLIIACIGSFMDINVEKYKILFPFNYLFLSTYANVFIYFSLGPSVSNAQIAVLLLGVRV